MNTRVPAFVTVGALGFSVQMTALFAMVHLWHWPYLLSTALAVEAAVVHNFVWHERWTWRDRDLARRGIAPRLVRFSLGNGLTSVVGNVLLTAIGVEWLHAPPLLANAAAVVATTLANFTVADRWVFASSATAGVLGLALLSPADAQAAELRSDTLVAWNRHVATLESALDRHLSDPPAVEPEGSAVSVPGGLIHEWRGSTVIHGMTVGRLVGALESRGLPPPAEDILDARVLDRQAGFLRVYMRLTRTALITVTYDTEHIVSFAQHSATFATSRSVSSRIREDGSSDRGFLWRLNSYWRYRQQGDSVIVDVLSVSLSRDVPALARPIAGPIIERIARDSMRRTLAAVARYGERLAMCPERCIAEG